MSLDHFGFGAPLGLLVLLVLPLLPLSVWAIRRRRTRYVIAFTNLEALKRVRARRRGRRVPRLLPLALLLCALAVATLALAAPHVRVESTERGASIVLLVDVSDSMRATDVLPSRLRAAVGAMHQFIGVLPRNDRLGLVSFSDKVNVLAAPTTDHAAVGRQLDVLSPQGGTALGDGVEGAVKLLSTSLAAAGVHRDGSGRLPAAIVLESDGSQNRGTATPLAAAQLAKAAGIRIYGVALGKRTGIIREGKGYFELQIPVPPDPDVVALLARQTGGQAFAATSAARLDQIYRQLGTRVSRSPETTAIGSWFELVAALLLMAAVGLARLYGPVLP